MRTDRGVGAHTIVRLAFGLAVMLIGALLTLDNFGLLEVRGLIRFWPVLLIGLGMTKLFYSLNTRAHPVGYLMIALGVVLLLVNLGLLQFRQAFALALLAVGANIVWRAARSPDPPTCDKDLKVDADPSRRLEVLALLGGIQRALGAQDFRGGNATAVMGGCEIDLSKASIEGGEAVLNTFAFWGGIDIKVPEDWTVETRGVALLGGFADSSRRPDDDNKKLILTGYALMGGVEVHN